MNGIENILEQEGIGLAITGMSIVFIALLLITFYIAFLPTLLKHLDKILPEQKSSHQRAEGKVSEEEDLMVAAAIATAFRRRRKLKETR
ncbi:OadG family protein [Opitutia bacterium ISCC 51]|nr:OadG family protein [Opitutae bacterium ISCC 51]QXD28698.1 OadG family protein [Opitutae bacterium ISCC 52]